MVNILLVMGLMAIAWGFKGLMASLWIPIIIIGGAIVRAIYTVFRNMFRRKRAVHKMRRMYIAD